jgi:L-ascorbate metabolism protein UlaG (beta-lactamase superfamily)
VTAAVTYVGHSTVLVELDGARVLTDPVLRSRILHLRRTSPVGRELLHRVDAALISHAHWDHLDVPSLKRLGRATTLVVPRGAGGFLRRRRFENVLEVEEGEEVQVGPLTVAATHAEHDGSRGRLGIRAPALGFVVAGSRRVYFAGDTGLFAGMAQLAPLDVALVPITGWGKAVGSGHLDPQRAAEALALLQPRIAVPIHWGTFAPFHHRRPTGLPADEFVLRAAREAPHVEVRVLRSGEKLSLDAGEAA